MEKENIEKLLIIVDMVNGFIREGSMADSYIEHIIPEIVEKIKEYKNEIVFIKDCHEENSIEFNSYPKHCIKGTKESELVEELKMFENEAIAVYEKKSTSAMFAENFIKDIDEMKNIKEITIVGCCTDICVLNLAIPLKNYLNQKNKNVEIVVPKKMVETYNSENHNREEYNEIAFKLLNQSGIKVI